MGVLCGREKRITFAPDDTVIPDLKGAAAFEFAYDSVGRAYGMVTCLEDGGDLLRDCNREYEEI